MEGELDEAIFTTLLKSFVEQWEKNEPKFVTYFRNITVTELVCTFQYVTLR